MPAFKSGYIACFSICFARERAERLSSPPANPRAHTGLQRLHEREVSCPSSWKGERKSPAHQCQQLHQVLWPLLPGKCSQSRRPRRKMALERCQERRIPALSAMNFIHRSRFIIETLSVTVSPVFASSWVMAMPMGIRLWEHFPSSRMVL